jgi:hypothetical protein
MKLINLTPHTVNIIRSDGSVVTLEPETAPTPRLAVVHDPVGELDGIEVVRSVLDEPQDLPDQTEGVVLIVSALIAEHPSLSHRTDLAAPGAAVRDTEGRVVACQGLCAGPGLATFMRCTKILGDGTPSGANISGADLTGAHPPAAEPAAELRRVIAKLEDILASLTEPAEGLTTQGSL